MVRSRLFQANHLKMKNPAASLRRGFLCAIVPAFLGQRLLQFRDQVRECVSGGIGEESDIDPVIGMGETGA